MAAIARSVRQLARAGASAYLPGMRVIGMVVVAIAGCSGKGGAPERKVVEASAPVVVDAAERRLPGPPGLGRCGDLATDSIAGIQVHRGEVEVKAVTGAPVEETAATRSGRPDYTHPQWSSAWGWPAHDLRITWISLDEATAPRKVFSVELGEGSDLGTSCGIRIGSRRVDVEQAYAEAIAAWKKQWAGALAAGVIDGPADPEAAADRPVMMVSGDGMIVGYVGFEDDRVVAIGFTHAQVLFANQW